MNEYEFTLAFRLPGAEESPEKYVEALGASGCDDALIGIGKLGSIALNFSRESRSALQAIASAIRDVKAVIPDAVLTEATPDFVGMTDIAALYGTSRQYIRKVVTAQARSFPAPVHEGNPSLWHLADVLGWISQHEPRKLDKSLLELARLTMQINSCKAFRKATDASGLSVDIAFNGPRKQARWEELMREAMGETLTASPAPARKRARRKLQTA